MCRTDLGAGLESLTLLLVTLEADDSTSRTYIGTTGTFRTAMATLEAHGRCHHIHQIATWTKHSIRTLTHTKLTTGAMLLQVLQRDGTRRTDRRLTLKCLLVEDGSKTAIGGLLLGLQGRGCQNGSTGGEEGATSRAILRF